jgi:hypothetical protein
MSDKEKTQKSETELQREAFQGIKGRLPQTDRELQESGLPPRKVKPRRFRKRAVLASGFTTAARPRSATCNATDPAMQRFRLGG